MYEISTAFPVEDDPDVAWNWLYGVLTLCDLSDTHKEWTLESVELDPTASKKTYKFKRPKDGTR
jgi:hypothetical protein